MHADNVRWLFDYDRWATRRILTALEGVDAALWEQPNAVGERGLGGILVHHLGASQRWRIGLQSRGADEGPAPENEPLPAVRELIDRWEAEWSEVDAWLPTLTDEFVAFVFDGVPGVADARTRRQPRDAASGRSSRPAHRGWSIPG